MLGSDGGGWLSAHIFIFLQRTACDLSSFNVRHRQEWARTTSVCVYQASVRDSRNALLLQLVLKAEELAHEVEVGGDTGTSATRELQGLVHAEALGEHQVGDAYRGRAGDACEAVYQHATSLTFNGICAGQREGKHGKGPLAPHARGTLHGNGCVYTLTDEGGSLLEPREEVFVVSVFDRDPQVPELVVKVNGTGATDVYDGCYPEVLQGGEVGGVSRHPQEEVG